MNVGRTSPRFSTIFSIRPSTADRKPSCSWAESRTLPNEWASGSQSSWTSSMLRIPSASIAAPSYVQQDWVSSTPLGLPVVPDV